MFIYSIYILYIHSIGKGCVHHLACFLITPSIHNGEDSYEAAVDLSINTFELRYLKIFEIFKYLLDNEASLDETNKKYINERFKKSALFLKSLVKGIIQIR